MHYLTLTEAAKRLRVRRSKVVSMVKTLRLPAINLADPGQPPQFRVSVAAIDQCLAYKPPEPKRRRRRKVEEEIDYLG